MTAAENASGEAASAVPLIPQGFPGIGDRPESEPEFEVLHFLRQQGYCADAQVWDASRRYRIDIAVKNPATGHYVLAVEYDGHAYHSKPEDRDRDAARQEFLESEGWQFLRIDREWFRNPENTRRLLLEAADRALRNDGGGRTCRVARFQSCPGAGAESGRNRKMDENLPHTEDSIRSAGNTPEAQASREDAPSGSGVQESRKVTIQVTMSTFLNLSLYQASYPLISDIRFFSPEQDFDDITIRVSCEYGVFEPLELKADTLQHGSWISVSGYLDRIVLKAAMFAELTETVKTAVEVALLDSAGAVIAQESRPLEITPYNQWLGQQELLSSFVTPNFPGVPAIIGRAETILREIAARNSRYRDSAASCCFDGYQTEDPQYVALEAEALYVAARELGLSYRIPPASFIGQRIRTFNEIINERTGTCLDTACLYATLLEAAGLRALLFLVDGHAFAGAELAAQPVFHTPVTTDREEVFRANEVQDILMVETTKFSSDAPFNAAVSEAGIRFAGKKFEACVSIQVCRDRLIRPLPLLNRDSAGSLVLTEDPRFVKDLSAESGSVVIKRRMTGFKGEGEITREMLWENKLLDLTTRNRLLNMKTSTGAVARIYFADPNALEDEFRKHDQKFFKLRASADEAGEIFRNGMNPETLELTASLDTLVRNALSDNGVLFVRNETRKSLEQVLRKLAQEARASYDENGANSLFLSLFSVLWIDETPARKTHEAPLMLLPVEIKKEARSDNYAIKVRDEELILNYSLIELMRQCYGIDLRGFLSNLPDDEYGVAVDVIKDAVLEVLPPGWRILKTVCLGNFSFRKFVMWQDLSNNSAHLRSTSPVYAALASGKFGAVAAFSDNEVPETIDERLSFGQICQPIQADSSQLDAVMAAESGKSFVLQGPPGTGKSQTITNIIAAALDRGRKVLFVAAKMAALEVVQERLDRLGLAPFCLELHSNSLTKSRFLERVNIEVPASESSPGTEYDIVKNRINAERDDLNALVKALHTPVAAGMSVYGAVCQLVRTGLEPEVTLTPDNLPDIDAAMISEADQAMRELRILTRGRKLSDYTFFESTLLKAPEGASGVDAAAFSGNAAALQECAASLAAVLGYPEESLTLERITAVLSGISEALSREDMDFALLSLASPEEFIRQAEEAVSTALQVREGLAKLGPNAADVFSLNLREELKIWKLDSERFFIMRILAHGKSVGRLQRALGVEVKVTSDNYQEIVESALRLQELRDSLGDLTGKLSRVNSDFASLTEKDPERARGLLDTLKALTAVLGSGLETAEQRSVREALTGNAAMPDFRERLQKLAAFAGPVAGFSEKLGKLAEFYRINRELLPGGARKLATRALGWVTRAGDFAEWLEINRRLGRLRSAGFLELAEALLRDRAPVSGGEGYAMALFARSLVEWQFASSEALSGFNPDIFEDRIAKFNEDAAAFRKLSGQLLVERLTAARNRIKSDADETLRDEITFFEKIKKSRGRGSSIRQIFNRIPHLMPLVAPCMLMSPISVAQYLAPDRYSFDLIIFDEASQLPTSEAVGAIGRGRQVIVVGDPKQMPPTDFFDARQSEESEIADLESVLDDCMTLGMPVRTLSWHYRSRHESLISFSNTMYYDSRLYTFPSPDDMNSRVHYHYVNGVYDRGGKSTNPEESRAVAAYIRDFLKNPGNRETSVGIVTFNTKQQAQIEEDLAVMFRENPDLETLALNSREPLFIKNLENVQGDERDVIVFSVGFGKDREGKVSMNFGPLNRDGGERRLNVAVTRARKEMVVFTSLEPEDARITASTSRGVTGLFEFLKYARNGAASIARQLETSRREKDYLVEQLAEELRKVGFDSRSGVGTSSFRVDLAVRDPSNPDCYLAGIMADGIVFRNTPCAQDRFSGQPGVLRGLGWKILRFWTPEWWRNREGVIARLSGELRKLEEEARVSARAVNEAASAPDSPEEAPEVPRKAEEPSGPGK
ncbi:DUF4011 domain-containing protein [Succinimonas amylolytica]|uniref:DUF4011 domain-containing protein n=1 Tax=Succinimonas amylolytica TaxID=83769 RepID=UPI0023A8CB12